LGDQGSPGFGHGPRRRSTAALTRLFSPEPTAGLLGLHPVANLVCMPDPEFNR